tara:strand:- start:185 stop:1141 length:957 start_codon:yes stop_codon:yes gene_type:complete
MIKYPGFHLIYPNEEQINSIQEVINTHNGSVFHEYKLNKIFSLKFKTELFYLVNNPDNISIACPIHKEKLENNLIKYHSIPLYDIPYGGFVGYPIPVLSKFSLGFNEALNYTGFPYSDGYDSNALSKYSYGETCMVDLSLAEDEIFDKILDSNRRNMIRKAIKNNIIIKKYFSKDGLNEFWKILSKLHDKLGYSQLTYDLYLEIFNKYKKLKKIFTLIAYKEDRVISGILVIGNSSYMHYYKGASETKIKNYGQGELLQWEAIKLAKELGTSYYDLCNLNKKKLPSIYKFKTGISNKIYLYPKYTYKTISSKILSRIK